LISLNLQGGQGTNPFPLLPPINANSSNNSNQVQQVSIDHIVNDPHIPFYQNSPRGKPDPAADSLLVSPSQLTQKSQSELPVHPIYLNAHEEANLINDVAKELRDCPSESLKAFYNEMTSYDPTASGFIHHAYVSLCAMRNNVSPNSINKGEIAFSVNAHFGKW
jgi:hypothetical protein